MPNMICFSLIYMEKCLKCFSNGMDRVKASYNFQSLVERGMVVLHVDHIMRFRRVPLSMQTVSSWVMSNVMSMEKCLRPF